ncbi:MAG: GNAT family N-acetyltransferase [Nanoarchaeota archaeon]|nr:GNAT family N-acetyltransferase [Nanoarchaeota archaeon]
MINDIIIRHFKKKDKKQIAAIHREAFRHALGEENYQTYFKEDLDRVLEDGNLVIAEHEKRVVGFAEYIRLGDSQYERETLEKWLGWVNQPHFANYSTEALAIHRAEFEKAFQEQRKQLGHGDVVAIVHENSLTQNLITITDNDFYFKELAVTEKYRRQGIGTKLVTERINIAREKEASLILVNCLIGGDGAKVYNQHKLGFLPIIEGSPVFDNGAGIRVYGKKL